MKRLKRLRDGLIVEDSENIMNGKRPKSKLASKIDKADQKRNGKEKGSKKRNGPGRPSERVHPIGELTSQYGAAEGELERVGAPKLSRDR